MWNIKFNKNKNQVPEVPDKKKFAAPVSSSLEDLITSKRKRLECERDEIPTLKRRAVDLRTEADSLTRRFEHRIRSDMLKEAESLEREIDVRASRVRDMEFDIVARRYMKQYKSNANQARPSVDRRREGDESRIITVPGVGVETAQCFSSTMADNELKRQAIVHEFLMEHEDRAPKLTLRARDDCPFCQVGLLMNGVKSMLVCKQCGYTLPYLDSTTQNMSYTDEYDFSTFSYKRQSHFDDILKLVQGKESLVVGNDIITAIMRELHAQRVRKEDITPMRVRNVMKKLKLKRAYDHVSQVTMRITGVRSCRISAEMEDRCKAMFVQMQPVFEKYCPKNRKNFLSYNYVLFRCFHILGLYHMLPSISLLKGKEKLLLQDEIFERIAGDLQWPFEPIGSILGRLQMH